MWDRPYHEPILKSHSLATNWTPEAILLRGFPSHVQQPQFREAAHRSSVLTARSIAGFPGENDDKWVRSHQAIEQLFCFRFSIAKKSSERRKFCQLGQQQIPECSGFSLFDKMDKPQPIPTKQKVKTLFKETKHTLWWMKTSISPSVMAHIQKPSTTFPNRNASKLPTSSPVSNRHRHA